MNELQIINKEGLECDRYLISLVNEGQRAGLLSDMAGTQVQAGILNVFRQVMIRYTKGKSNTLRIEMAEELMESLLFALDLHLMNQDTPEKAIDIISSVGIENLYTEALETLHCYVQETVKIYESIEEQRTPVHNDVYNETFQDAIPKFLKEYDPVFFAHNSGSDIDYPLNYDDLSGRGIRYIRNYMETFLLEDHFCGCFMSYQIERLINAYGKKFQVDAKLIPLNIFDVIFPNALFLVLLGESPNQLILSGDAVKILNVIVDALDDEKLNLYVQDGTNRMAAILGITEPKVLRLINRYAGDLSLRIRAAVDGGGLESLAVTDVEESLEETSVIESGGSLHPSVMKYLYEQITQTESTKEKLVLLHRYLRSAEDMITLLRADCFLESDYPDIFDSLSTLEIGLLIKQGIGSVLFQNALDVHALIQEAKNGNYIWERALARWFSGLNEERHQAIGEVMCRLLKK